MPRTYRRYRRRYRRGPFARARRYRPRRLYRRKKMRNRNARLTVKRMPAMWPDAIKCVLKFDYLWTPTSATAIAYGYWAINDPRVPDSAASPATLTQAAGFDQWGTIYNRYFCTGSSIRLGFRLASTEVSTITLTPLLPDNAPSGSNVTLENMGNQPFTKSINVGNVNVNQTAYIKHYMTMRKLVGSPLDHENYSGSTNMVSGASVASAYTGVWLVAVFGDNAIDDMKIKIQVRYYCRFYQKKFVPASVI